MDGALRVQQPVGDPVDGEAHHATAAMMRLGLPDPGDLDGAAQGVRAASPTSQPTLERYAQLFDLGEIGAKRRLPDVHEAVRRRRLGRRLAASTTRRRCARPTSRAASASCTCRRRSSRYDLLRALHRLRAADARRRATTRRRRCTTATRWTATSSPDDEAELLRDMTLTINAFFGWDFNSCEALRQDGDLAPDRLRQRLPRLAGDVAPLPLPVAGEGQPALVALLRRHEAHDAHEPRLGRRSSTIARARPALPREARAPTRRSRASASTPTASRSSAPSTSRTSTRWRGSSSAPTAAKDAVRQKVAALFPAHEVEPFTELFWSRIQKWRDEAAAGAPPALTAATAGPSGPAPTTKPPPRRRRAAKNS